MPIIVNLDVVLAQRKMRLNDLAEAVDITPQNLSILKTGKARAIRFSTQADAPANSRMARRLAWSWTPSSPNAAG